MPVIAAGEVCIRRLARTFDGLIEGGNAVRYRCRNVGTERMPASVTFRITAKMGCDHVGGLVPITGLRAKGTTVRRADGLRTSPAGPRSSTRRRIRTWCCSAAHWI